jgi:hypothetical protein
MPEDRYAYFQRKSDERTQNKATAAQALRDTAAAAAPTPEAPETRSFGFRNTGGAKAAEAHLTQANVSGARLGDPTSYGGQAPLRPEEVAQSEARVDQGQQDFAKPIQVIRRMTSTYQGPQAGEELASPGQAAQAFRRDNGADFVPEGGAKLGLQHQQRLEEIAAQGKSQEASMAGDLMTRKKNSEAFMNRIQSDPRFYKEGPEGLQPIIPGLGQLVLGFKAMGESDPDKAFQAFEGKALRHIDETKHVNDQGVATAVTNLTNAGFTLTPGQKAWMATPQADPEAEKKRRDTILQWVKPTAIPGGAGQPGAPGGATEAAPGQPSNLMRSRGIDMQSLQRNAETGPAPLSVGPAQLSPTSLLRPDQLGKMTDQFQRKTAERNNLAALSKDTEDRLKSAAY